MIISSAIIATPTMPMPNQSKVGAVPVATWKSPARVLSLIASSANFRSLVASNSLSFCSAARNSANIAGLPAFASITLVTWSGDITGLPPGWACAGASPAGRNLLSNPLTTALAIKLKGGGSAIAVNSVGAPDRRMEETTSDIAMADNSCDGCRLRLARTRGRWFADGSQVSAGGIKLFIRHFWLLSK